MIFHGQVGSSLGFCVYTSSQFVCSVRAISVRICSSFHEYQCTAAVPYTAVSCERTSGPVSMDKRCDPAGHLFFPSFFNRDTKPCSRGNNPTRVTNFHSYPTRVHNSFNLPYALRCEHCRSPILTTSSIAVGRVAQAV